MYFLDNQINIKFGTASYKAMYKILLHNFRN